jgi:2,3-bisphosphoglycerate-dependent phosphoglycerate mutase
VELALIRHGRPERVEHADGTPADPGLSTAGQEQARRVAEWLAAEAFDAVWSSPMRRAVETARPLADALGVDVVVDDELAELDRGHHFYVPIEELRETGDPRYEQLLRGELYGNVDLDTFTKVAALAVHRVLEANEGRRVAVFCHGGVINAFTSRLLGIDRQFFFAPAYTSITRFRPSEYSGELALWSLNETPHLRELDLRTA